MNTIPGIKEAYIGNTKINELYIGDKLISFLEKPILIFREEGHYETADAVLYDKVNDKKVVLPVENLSLINKDNYEPIGVVVIPSSHDVYGTGEAGVMSLVNMSATNPEIGSINYRELEENRITMCWGQTINIISNNLNVVNSINDDGSLKETYKFAYLPSDYFKGSQSPDPLAKYDTFINDYKAPSPYGNDGISRNPNYYSLEKSALNALSDFDGRENTNKILSLRGKKDYLTWKPIYDELEDYPAASCCDMFHTEGTKQGDWYLPACGELGYVESRFSIIQQSIKTIINAGWIELFAVLLGYGYIQHTSSECSDQNIYHITSGSRGTVNQGIKSNCSGVRIRAFTRIS